MSQNRVMTPIVKDICELLSWNVTISINVYRSEDKVDGSKVIYCHKVLNKLLELRPIHLLISIFIICIKQSVWVEIFFSCTLSNLLQQHRCLNRSQLHMKLIWADFTRVIMIYCFEKLNSLIFSQESSSLCDKLFKWDRFIIVFIDDSEQLL